MNIIIKIGQVIISNFTKNIKNGGFVKLYHANFAEI